jgi:hypothetical protein
MAAGPRRRRASFGRFLTTLESSLPIIKHGAALGGWPGSRTTYPPHGLRHARGDIAPMRAQQVFVKWNFIQTGRLRALPRAAARPAPSWRQDSNPYAREDGIGSMTYPLPIPKVRSRRHPLERRGLAESPGKPRGALSKLPPFGGSPGRPDTANRIGGKLVCPSAQTGLRASRTGEREKMSQWFPASLAEATRPRQNDWRRAARAHPEPRRPVRPRRRR